MEASVRIFNPSSLSLLNKTHSLKHTPKFLNHTFPNPPLSPQISFHSPSLYPNCPNSFTRIHASSPGFNSRNTSLLGFLLSLSHSLNLNSPISDDRFDQVESDSSHKFFEWHRTLEGGDGGLLGREGPLVTVVLLGWLGAKRKHLKRYVDLYTSRGIHAVTFVVPVKDVLWFDLGKRVENRISALSNELASWLSETEKDGRERSLLFHTFSNTGWLVYGSILDNLQCSKDLIKKIKGCVVDSGADPDLNPQMGSG